MLWLLGLLKGLVAPAKFVFKEVALWVARREEIGQAKHDAKVAEITAKTELAAYKMKTDLEWDLAWAGQASGTWKDEYLLLLFSVPVIVGFGVLIPGPIGAFWLQHMGIVIKGLQAIDPNITSWFWTGWGAIIAATFGNKALGNFMMGDKIKKVADAFAPLPDDVPEEAVQSVTDRIKAEVEKRKLARATKTT